MTQNPSYIGSQTIKSDNPGAGDMYFNVLDRSVIVLGLGELQNHEFWGVFMVGKFSKKKKLFFHDFLMFSESKFRADFIFLGPRGWERNFYFFAEGRKTPSNVP